MRVRLLDDKEHTEPFPKNWPHMNGFFSSWIAWAKLRMSLSGRNELSWTWRAQVNEVSDICIQGKGMAINTKAARTQDATVTSSHGLRSDVSYVEPASQSPTESKLVCQHVLFYHLQRIRQVLHRA